jgi:hypothetical protein
MRQKVQTKHCIPSRDLVLIVKKQMANKWKGLNIARSLSGFWDLLLASPRPGSIDSYLATSQPVQSELRVQAGFVDPPPYTGQYRPLSTEEAMGYMSPSWIELHEQLSSPSKREAPPAIGSEPSKSNEADIPGEANK